jgi:phosphatidylglycerol---prolipoprotein diacylglyceryl transferase
MFIHNISPIFFTIGPFELRYYGMAYFLSFLLFYFFLQKRKNILKFSSEMVDIFMFYILLGVLLGGRFGYIFFYHIDWIITDPLQILQVWEGGMSFHGGLIGVILALYIFSRKYKVSFWNIADFCVIPLALSLALGRFANFLNSELLGYPSDKPWCVVFSLVDDICRHPSQLYAMSKDFLLFFILSIFSFRYPFGSGILSSLFLIGYGFLRLLVDIFRMPDSHLLFVVDITGFSMGSLLSFICIFIGFSILLLQRKKILHKCTHDVQ